MENNVPKDIIDALIAAGGNSRLARQARVKRQLRDRKGRWIEMGGGMKTSFKLANGTIINVTGRSVGGSDRGEGYIQMHITGQSGVKDGFYTFESNRSEAISAILSEDALKRAGVDLGDNKGTLDSGVVDFADVTFADAPEGWKKINDNSYSTIEPGYDVTRNEDGTWNINDVVNNVSAADLNTLADAIVQGNDWDAEEGLSSGDKSTYESLRDSGDKKAADKVLRNEPVARLSAEQAKGVQNLPASETPSSDSGLAGWKESNKPTTRPSKLVSAPVSATAGKDPKTMTWTELADEIQRPVASESDIDRNRALNAEFYGRGGFQIPREDRDKVPVPEDWRSACSRLRRS
jgi:hypothetical protein